MKYSSQVGLDILYKLPVGKKGGGLKTGGVNPDSFYPEH
jgi:hypothetical protein